MRAIEYSKFVEPRKARFRDGLMTFDVGRTYDAVGNHRGTMLGQSVRTHDGRIVDSTGAFLVGELERLDYTLHEPLAEVSYGRDVDIRGDVTIGDEVSSFTLSTYAKQGGLGTGNGIGNGKSWLSQRATQVTGTSVDISKKAFLLYPWAQQIAYTSFDVEQAARTGRPLDAQMFEALKLAHQMDIDEMVYIGDTANGAQGLLNNSAVTATNVPAGAQGTTTWVTKSPDEILTDFNNAIATTWANAGWKVTPTDARIPPALFGYLATQKVSSAGNISILGYLLENNILKAQGKGNIRILPLKWCIGAGSGGTIGTTGTVDRMAIYTKAKNYVRYPMTMLQRTPVQFDSVWLKTTYFCKLGTLEWVYPETAAYYDGI